MRLGYAPLVAILGLMAACGRSPNAVVKFTGMTPQSSLVKDTRQVKAFCPQCRKQIDASETQCPDVENCGAEISLKEEYACPFCEGTGTCATCAIYQQTDGGKCMNCNGVGYLTYQGKTRPCPNCGTKDKEGDGKCPICKGSTKCDYCGGEGKISNSKVVELQVKPGQEAAEEEPADKP